MQSNLTVKKVGNKYQYTDYKGNTILASGSELKAYIEQLKGFNANQASKLEGDFTSASSNVIADDDIVKISFQNGLYFNENKQLLTKDEVLNFIKLNDAVLINGQAVVLNSEQSDWINPDENQFIDLFSIPNQPNKFLYDTQIITSGVILNNLKNNTPLRLDHFILALSADKNSYVIKYPVIRLTSLQDGNYEVKDLSLTLTSNQVVACLKQNFIVYVNNQLIGLANNALGFETISNSDQNVEEVNVVNSNLQHEYVNQTEHNDEITINQDTLSKLPTYFGVNLKQAVNNVNADNINYYHQLKELQGRLFDLSASSISVNLNSAGNLKTVINFIEFCNQYDAVLNQAKFTTFNELLHNGEFTFNFQKLYGKNKQATNLYNKLVQFDEMSQSIKNEFGDNYLNLGLGIMTGAIQPSGSDEVLNINAPLVFLTIKSSWKDDSIKAFSFTLEKKGTQLLFKPNVELLMFLVSKTKKVENTNETLLSAHTNLTDVLDNIKTILSSCGLEINLTNWNNEFDAKKWLATTPIVDVKLKNPSKTSKSTSNKAKQPLKAKNGSKVVKNAVNEKNPENTLTQQVPPFKQSEFKIHNACYLGNFIAHNYQLFKDYYNLLAHDGADFYQGLDNMYYNQLEFFQNQGASFQEEDLRQIVELDYSQKLACIYALKHNINIVGSAGSGKSQTISNIVANFISKHQSTLFCTDKKTASDVVLSRLNTLRYYCLPLYESPIWNTVLTTQIKNTLERIGQIYGQWDELNLNDEDTGKNNAGKKLDETFNQLSQFKKLMWSKTGYQYVDLMTKYSIPENKQVVNDTLNLIPQYFHSATDSVAFWKTLNQVKNIKEIVERVGGLINTMNNTTGFMLESEQNTFFKACYYSQYSPEEFEKYLVLIIQENREDDSLLLAQLNLDDLAHQSPDVINSAKENNQFKAIKSMIDNLKTSNFATLKLLQDQQMTVAQYKLYLENSQMENNTKVLEFLSKYPDSDKFNFKEIKEYLYLTEDWGVKNQAIMDIDKVDWFSQLNSIMINKVDMDKRLTELDFLKYVKEQLDASPELRDQYNRVYSAVANTKNIDDVKDFLVQYGAILHLLFPIVVASPNMVCKYISCQRGLFDHLIVDEASMMSIERAIPLMYRAKQYCIVGDKKQLQPLSYLSQINKLAVAKKQYESGKLAKEKYFHQVKLIESYKGLLDYLSSKIQKITLGYHYRSNHTSLIQFSNVAFYDSEVICENNYTNPSKFLDSGIEVYEVNGKYIDGVNKEEAHAIYQKLAEIAKANAQIEEIDKKTSVGIIVFSKAQKDYLTNLIIDKNDPNILNMKHMITEGEDKSLIIKDVANIQGDEKDIIMIGLNSSSKNKDKLMESFNLLNTDLGFNFLNVAISRNKQKLMVFKSIKANDIINNNEDTALWVYKQWLTYIETLATNGQDLSDNKIKNLFKQFSNKSLSANFDNLFKVKKSTDKMLDSIITYLQPKLDSSKYYIMKNVVVGNSMFNLAIFKKEHHLPVLGVLLDNYVKNINQTIKESDYYAKEYLRGRGWNLKNISVLQWNKLNDTAMGQIEFIEEILKEVGIYPVDLSQRPEFLAKKLSAVNMQNIKAKLAKSNNHKQKKVASKAKKKKIVKKA